VKDHWYCRVEGQQYGPYTWDQMRAMAAEGRVVAESAVRREADPTWFTAGKIPGLVGSPNVPPAAAKSMATALVKQATPESTSGPDVTSTVVPNGANGSPRQFTVKLKPTSPSNSQQLPTPPPLPNRPSRPAVVATSAPPAAPPRVAGANPKVPSPPIPTATEPTSPLGIVVAPPVANPSKPAVEEVPKGPSRLTLAALGVAALVVLLAIGGGVAAWRMSHSSAAKMEVASADQTKKDAPPKPLMSDAELDAILSMSSGTSAKQAPANATATAAKSDGLKATDENKAKESTASTLALAPAPPPLDPQIEAARKLVEEQKDWRPVESFFVANRSGTVRMEIAGMWLAKDALGIPVEPPQSDDEAAQAKFVFVEIRVTNEGDIPRKYTSWNTGEATDVILADDTNQPLALVPAAETPHAVRQTSLHIPPGHLIRDVLVFRAPARPFHALKLLLAQSVFAPGQRGYFPLEASAQALLHDPPPLSTAHLAAAEGTEPPEPGAPIPVPRRDLNAPESLDEFTKALNEDKKRRDGRFDSPPN
jgi:hypothetical protein